MNAAAAGNGDGPDREAASRVLVTGAAGFIGSHLCDRLLGEEYQVWGLDNFDDFYDPARKRRNLQEALRHASMHLVEGDVRDQILLDGLMGDVAFDVVIHLAARPGAGPSIENPELTFDVNVGGTLTLLEAMRRHGVPVLLFGSSASVYGASGDAPCREDAAADRPISPYGASKRAGEMLCHVYHHLHGLTVQCLRLFTVYGPRQRPDLAIHRFARLLARGEPLPVHGDGAGRRDYTYVDDVSDGILLSLNRARRRNGTRATYEIVNLGGGGGVRLEEMVSLLEGAMGKKARRQKMAMEPGRIRQSVASSDRGRELLGYRPQTDLEAGLKAFASWFAEEDVADRVERRSVRTPDDSAER